MPVLATNIGSRVGFRGAHWDWSFCDWVLRLLGPVFIDGLNGTLNDQVGYISAERHWLDDGRLDSSIIYLQPENQSLLRATTTREVPKGNRR